VPGDQKRAHFGNRECRGRAGEKTRRAQL
jgi:hypothetical protein